VRAEEREEELEKQRAGERGGGRGGKREREVEAKGEGERGADEREEERENGRGDEMCEMTEERARMARRQDDLVVGLQCKNTAMHCNSTETALQHMLTEARAMIEERARTAWRQCDVVVGLHPDEATDVIVQAVSAMCVCIEMCVDVF